MAAAARADGWSDPAEPSAIADRVEVGSISIGRGNREWNSRAGFPGVGTAGIWAIWDERLRRATSPGGRDHVGSVEISRAGAGGGRRLDVGTGRWTAMRAQRRQRLFEAGARRRPAPAFESAPDEIASSARAPAFPAHALDHEQHLLAVGAHAKRHETRSRSPFCRAGHADCAVEDQRTIGSSGGTRIQAPSRPSSADG